LDKIPSVRKFRSNLQSFDERRTIITMAALKNWLNGLPGSAAQLRWARPQIGTFCEMSEAKEIPELDQPLPNPRHELACQHRAAGETEVVDG
jgi:hypothetical protein